MPKTAPKKEENEVLSHVPVLLDEVLKHLDLEKKKNVVDATLGFGGHAKELLTQLPKNGKLIGFDADPVHLKAAKKNLRKFKDQVTFINSNFVHLQDAIKENTRVRSIDAFLFDLGIASPHVDDAERGFSFMQDGPLDMRFNPATQEVSAAHVVNGYSEKELVRIFTEYGEERWAKKIAREIVKTRKSKPFKKTKQLADFIEKLVVKPRFITYTTGKKKKKKKMAVRGRIHPATRVFQALRIEVNRELVVLERGLAQAVELLKSKGRIAVISYHSLEDRIVKHFFKELARGNGKPQIKIITKKPIVPTAEEVQKNPRARSAKLRIAEKI